MAKAKDKDKEPEVDETKAAMISFLKANKEHHYNYEASIDYKVSFGSLILDAELEGIGPGFHRFVGPTESGKTSQALKIMKNMFETVPNSKGYFVKAEGRLSENMMKRSGVKFVFDPEDWEVGTCFVLETNVFEVAMEAMRKLIAITDAKLKPEEKIKFCFVVDSVDGLCRRDDLDKPFTESDKIAGGAVISSAFAKRCSIGLEKRGHMAFFLAQLRAKVEATRGPRDKQKQDGGTGGNAVKHYADFIIEFKTTYGKDWITENGLGEQVSPKNKIEGRIANIIIHKSPNEKTGMTLGYPVKRGRVDGKCIWIEREVVDFLIGWELVIKKGGWFSFSDTVQEQWGIYQKAMHEVSEAARKRVEKKEFEPKEFIFEELKQIQGMNKVYAFFEEEEGFTQCMLEFCKGLIS